MNKRKLLRRLAMLLCLLLWMTSTVNTTFGYIVTATESLINTFIPEKAGEGTFTLEKLVEHPYGEDYVIPESISFNFEISLGASYANTTLSTSAGEITADEDGTLTAAVKPGKTFSLYDLAVGTPVTVTELPTEHKGFAPKDGISTRETVVAEDTETLLQFTNVYTPERLNLTDILVTGEKIRLHSVWEEGDTFTYSLEHLLGNVESRTAAGNWETLDTRTIVYDPADPESTKFDFSATMEQYTVASIGVYHFRMTELFQGIERHEHDDTDNHFEVHIEDNDMDGFLEIYTVTTAQNAEVTIWQGIHMVDVKFYDSPVPALPEDVTTRLSIHKTVENLGEVEVTPAGFDFLLENLTTGETLTLTSDSDGWASQLLTYTAEDLGNTYSYRLSEIHQGASDITYDTTVHTFTVSVEQGEGDTLTLVPSAELNFTFHNIADRNEIDPGDSSSLFWLITMLLSGTAFVVLFISDRKKRLPL